MGWKKTENVAVYNVTGIDLESHKEVFGYWIGDSGEGANFWLSVITDLQNRGVENIFITAVEDLSGFQM